MHMQHKQLRPYVIHESSLTMKVNKGNKKNVFISINPLQIFQLVFKQVSRAVDVHDITYFSPGRGCPRLLLCYDIWDVALISQTE